MLEDVDCFESEQDVVENVGIFLADCCHAKQVRLLLCRRLYGRWFMLVTSLKCHHHTISPT